MQQQSDEGELTTFTFGVQLPETGTTTRVMGSEAINTLHAIVFDEQGYYTYKALAELAAVADDESPNDPTLRQFTVQLPNSSAKRIIHFVANISSAQYDGIDAGHEDGVMSSLYVETDADAYWQRMVFDAGISENATNNAFKNDVIVPLIRNYARVTVKNEAKGFTFMGFKVYNTRTQGSIAAYDSNNGTFAEFTEMNPAEVDGKKFTPKTYPEMADYSCHEMGEIVQNGVGGYATSAVTEQTAYVRETSVNSNPYIIIYGKYGGQPYYYKLDFMVSGHLANVLRNFSYNFTIKSVTKAGYTDENDAKNQPRGENGGLSFDAGTQSLLNISDGAGQLFVSATTAVLVNTNTYYLMYKYIPDINNPADNVNVGVSHDAKSGDVISKFTEGTVGDTNTSGAEFADYAGYKYIAITPNTPGNTIAMQKIVITNNGNLTRTVTLYLQKPYQMSVNAYDGGNTPINKEDEKVPEELNQKVWVDVTIPSDIEEALFPLEFVFEADALSIYPDATANNMPVRSGTSIIPNKTETTFGFVYTLTWEEYVDLKNNADEGASTVTFTAKFLTNKAKSATTVYVYNEYFTTTTGYDDFKNSKLERTNNITVTLGSGADYYGAGRPVTLDITLLEAPAGTEVSVDVTGFNITGTKATTYTTDSNGQVKLSLSTSDWGGPRSVTVSSTAVVETETAIIKYNQGSTSTTVKKIDIPAGKFKLGSEISQTTTLYYENGSSTEETVVFGYYYNESDTNSAKTIEIEGLEENTKLYLHYTSWSYGAGTTTYKTGLFSVKDLVNDGIINLTFQK